MDTPWKWKTLTPGSKALVIFNYAVILFFTLLVLLPLLYVLQVTVSNDITNEFRLIPHSFTFDHYIAIFKEGYVTRPFLNSCYVTVLSVIYSMFITMLVAYPLSRKELVGRKLLNFLVLLPMVFSFGFLPGYLLIRDLNLLDTYAALILPGAVSTFNLIILRNFLSSIPESLIESAKLDGAAEMQILFRIVLPLSQAAIATVTLFYMVGAWNEYFSVILYINNPTRYTLQVFLRQMVMENESVAKMENLYVQNMQYATIVIAMLPIMAVYPFLSRYFMKGIMLGSVKG